MKFEKKKWKSFGGNTYKLDIVIKDQDFRRIANIKTTGKEFPKILKDINTRFGIPIDSYEDEEDELSFLNKAKTKW